MRAPTFAPILATTALMLAVTAAPGAQAATHRTARHRPASREACIHHKANKGTAIGAGAGAVLGYVAGGPVGGKLGGAVIGAGAGAVVGHAIAKHAAKKSC